MKIIYRLVMIIGCDKVEQVWDFESAGKLNDFYMQKSMILDEDNVKYEATMERVIEREDGTLEICLWNN